MNIRKLDHVNLRTGQLDRMIAWYTDILGLRSGKRPDFGFPGAWMYAGDVAVVHLVEVGADSGAGSEGALKLEHFAFAASGRTEFEAHLKAHDVGFRCADIPSAGLVQYNINDPDGNHIHVDFSLEE